MQHICPIWCNGIHEISDDLRVAHRSDVMPVAAIEKRIEHGGTSQRVAVVDLALGLEERDGEMWVWISPEDDVRRGLVLTIESTRRLHRSLDRLLRLQPTR